MRAEALVELLPKAGTWGRGALDWTREPSRLGETLSMSLAVMTQIAASAPTCLPAHRISDSVAPITVSQFLKPVSPSTYLTICPFIDQSANQSVSVYFLLVLVF